MHSRVHTLLRTAAVFITDLPCLWTSIRFCDDSSLHLVSMASVHCVRVPLSDCIWHRACLSHHQSRNPLVASSHSASQIQSVIYLKGPICCTAVVAVLLLLLSPAYHLLGAGSEKIPSRMNVSVKEQICWRLSSHTGRHCPILQKKQWNLVLNVKVGFGNLFIPALNVWTYLSARPFVPGCPGALVVCRIPFRLTKVWNSSDVKVVASSVTICSGRP